MEISNIQTNITAGDKYKSVDLPEKFRKSNRICEGKETNVIKCYSLHKDRLLKFDRFPNIYILFVNNYYMDLKDMIDLEFQYQILLEKERSSNRKL